MPRTIAWDGDAIVILDQTLLPDKERLIRLNDVEQLVEAIRSLRIRGAPALGVAGAFGVALAAKRAEQEGRPVEPAARDAAARLAASRPTAVNLRWGIDRVLDRLHMGADAVIKEAQALLEADVATNHEMAKVGAAWVEARFGDRRLRVLTHCNTGALACVDWGTALGVIRATWEAGRIAEVLAAETRPLLQGSRLTAWELEKLQIPYRIMVDGAGPSLIARGDVDLVVVGADRVARNHDVANKVGTYPLALAADRARVPFVVVAPTSSIDAAIESGDQIPIEERPEEEVLCLGGRRIAPASARAFNPAFDVTPAALITAIVTEEGVIEPAPVAVAS
jgi:methylthioribose-1-phosphate isomerase